MKRNIGLDFVRLIAFIFVVCVHALDTNVNIFVYKACQTLFFTCNGMFYMLSGYFALSGWEKDIKYGNYFRHKCFTLFFPFATLTFLLYLRCAINNISIIYTFEFWRDYFVALFNSNASTHLWFMYPLIGMTITAPFLGKMLHDLDDDDLKMLIIVSIVWNLVTLTFLSNTIIGQSFSCVLLSSWLLLYVLGFCYRRNIHKDISIRVLLIIFILCYILTFIQTIYFPNHAKSAHDLSGLYVIFTYILFHFLNQLGNSIRRSVAAKIVSFLASHTFPAYIFHMCILNKIKTFDIRVENALMHYLLIVFIVALLSLLVGVICDLLIVKFIKKLEYCISSTKKL